MRYLIERIPLSLLRGYHLRKSLRNLGFLKFRIPLRYPVSLLRGVSFDFWLKFVVGVAVIVFCGFFHQGSGYAGELPAIAVLDFKADGEALQDLGPQVTGIIHTYLSAQEGITLVERADIDRVLSEIELGLSGLANRQSVAQLGQLVGAKVLVTGRVFAAENELIIVAKIIGTETGLVMGQSVKAPLRDSYAEAAQELAEKIAALIQEKSQSLTAVSGGDDDPMNRMKELADGKKELPTVTVSIPEVHVGKPALDPAAETTISKVLRELGFPLLDAAAATDQPDIEITGEAFSEFALRKGNLISCKGRVEVKAVKRSTGEIIAIDQETQTAVDLSEYVAGKIAIENAAQAVVYRILTKIYEAI